jgi:2-amino-4-hydroxy-6-hydroxymethyldihydropteridine diphosphokinase
LSELVYAGIGGNIGDPATTMRDAASSLDREEGVRVLRASTVYRNPPLGPQDQPAFLNAVIELETTLGARALLALFLKTEKAFGRVRAEKWGPRRLDLDILFYGDAIVEEPGLSVPHPFAHERPFVLKPLCDLNPHLVHPTAHRTVADLLSQTDDSTMEPIPDIALIEA